MNHYPGPDGQGLLQKGPVEADEAGFGRLVPRRHFEGFHAAEAEPLVRGDESHRMDGAAVGESGEGNEPRPVFIVAWIVREEVGYRRNAEAAQSCRHRRAGSPERRHGLSQFMEEHSASIA